MDAMIDWRVSTRWVVGYHDPVRRRRVRAAARRLVPARMPTGELSADEIARLCLLRVLWLQHETRRAAGRRQREAAISLARASIEATITGLYCLSAPDVTEEFERQTGKALKVFVGDVAAGTVELDLSGFLDAEFGQGRGSSTMKRAEDIVERGGPSNTEDVYSRYYWPLSAAYAHAGPIALLRHVDPRRGTTRQRPSHLWSGRSAANTADAMVGVLAGAIAGEEHPASSLFRTYAAEHWRVVVAPLFFLTRRLVLTRVRWIYLPRVVGLIRRLGRSRDLEASQADVEEVLLAMRDLFGIPHDDEPSQRLLEELRASLFDEDGKVRR